MYGLPHYGIAHMQHQVSHNSEEEREREGELNVKNNQGFNRQLRLSLEPQSSSLAIISASRATDGVDPQAHANHKHTHIYKTVSLTSHVAIPLRKKNLQ